MMMRMMWLIQIIMMAELGHILICTGRKRKGLTLIRNINLTHIRGRNITRSGVARGDTEEARDRGRGIEDRDTDGLSND